MEKIMRSNLPNKMQIVCLLAIQLLTFSTVFASSSGGAIAGGGGDPIEQTAEVFQELEKLNLAKSTIQEKLNKTDIPDSFKESFLNEFDSLLNQQKFKVLPALIILGAGNGPETYSLPHDADTFLSLGGMTGLQKGASIYLSERVTKYDGTRFTRLILHEVLHHVLITSLSKNEFFVNLFTNEIMIENISDKVKIAIMKGYFFTDDNVDLDQFINFVGLNEDFKSFASDGLKNYLRINLGQNISNQSINSTFDYFSLAFEKYNPAYQPYMRKKMYKNMNELALLQSGVQLDKEGFFSWGCKEKIFYMQNCKNPFKISEIYSK
jgi:hypothetical protein